MKSKKPPQALSPDQATALLGVLASRFEKYRHRHPGIEWMELETRLMANPGKLWSLQEMETTGGEPDVIGRDTTSGEFIFCDCAEETPKGRTSVCYDREALDSRKEHKPKTSAMDMAAAMGIEMLTEAQYRDLQKLGEFDNKTSSWVRTPADIRKLGGALFGDRRFGHIFIYHNGAQSYYGARAFRGMLRV